MKTVLIIEKSSTLRHLLKKKLNQHNFSVLSGSSFAEGLNLLQKHSKELCVVIIGWPTKTDLYADELFAVLEMSEYKSLAAIVMSDQAAPASLNWSADRAKTALLLWTDYQKISHTLADLLSETSESTAVNRITEAFPCVQENNDVNVLFVDDSPTIRFSYRKLLNENGYHTDVASSVEEAMQMALKQHYDIAIVDYFMPDATGDVLCKQLKENTKTEHIATAIFTGSYLDRVIEDSLAAGAVECMFKNESKSLFLARVKAMIRAVRNRNSIIKERRYLEGILGSVGDGVYGVNDKGKITFINVSAKEMLGYDSEQELIGKKPHALFHYASGDGADKSPDDSRLVEAYSSEKNLGNWQTVFWTKDKRPIPVECTVFPLTIDDKREGSVVAFRDMSQNKLMEEELQWNANHDWLTKLLNRQYFDKVLDHEVKHLKNTNQISVLLYIDLDQFKYLNDTAGHSAGDQLLIETSNFLQSRVRSSDVIARLGGDEFAVLLRKVKADRIFEVADSFRQLISNRTFSYAGKNYKINASVGVCVLNSETSGAGEALSNADLASFIAKEKGRNQTHIFDANNDDRKMMDMDLGWSAKLHEALESDRFQLVYHPIVRPNEVPLNMKSTLSNDKRWSTVCEQLKGKSICYEVLLRLQGKDSKKILPGSFLPTAERFHLMPQIDRWVIKEALRVLAEETGKGNKISFSINLSAQTLVDPNLAKDIKSLIKQYNVDPRDIMFEITETSAITNMEAAKLLINDLKSIGCKFALDDFGTGFSSFTHLKFLNVDYLKIDGTFTKGLINDPIDREVVNAINNIAHTLGKQTIAEFVENAEIVSYLKNYGVDFLQGYYISEPLESISVVDSFSTID